MAELISFAKEQDVGPIGACYSVCLAGLSLTSPPDALKSLADKIREEQPQLSMMNGFGTNSFFPNGGSSMPSSAQGNTLYSSAPPSVTNPAAVQQPSSSMSSPKTPRRPRTTRRKSSTRRSRQRALSRPPRCPGRARRITPQPWPARRSSARPGPVTPTTANELLPKCLMRTLQPCHRTSRVLRTRI
jgi:hypothetical protein